MVEAVFELGEKSAVLEKFRSRPIVTGCAVITSEAKSDDGMFDVHRIGDRLFFEIPDALLGRDMLIMSRYAKTQDGLADGGACRGVFAGGEPHRQ